MVSIVNYEFVRWKVMVGIVNYEFVRGQVMGALRLCHKGTLLGRKISVGIVYIVP